MEFASLQGRLRDMNATGLPPWFRVADIGTSQASHSTTNGLLSSIDFKAI